MVESVHWKSLGCMTQEIKGKIGLYFGTFNPVHLGHLVIANHMAHYTDLDEVVGGHATQPAQKPA